MMEQQSALAVLNRIWICAALIILTASTARAEPASDISGGSPLMEPLDKWQVDYGENKCRLLRSFGATEQPVVLQIGRDVAPGSYNWTIGGAPLPAYSAGTKIRIVPASEADALVVEAQPYKMIGRGEPMIKWHDRDGVLFKQVVANPVLHVNGAKGLDIRLRLPGIAAALQALDKCQDDLMAEWGMTPADLAAIATPPKPTGNPGAWATDADYPPEARSQRNEGIVLFRLFISPEGKVTDCKVIESSSFANLDVRTCDLMRARATFLPARNAVGDAVKGTYSNRVWWQVPR